MRHNTQCVLFWICKAILRNDPSFPSPGLELIWAGHSPTTNCRAFFVSTVAYAVLVQGYTRAVGSHLVTVALSMCHICFDKVIVFLGSTPSKTGISYIDPKFDVWSANLVPKQFSPQHQPNLLDHQSDAFSTALLHLDWAL